jgi:central glycolytic genes regulator
MSFCSNVKAELCRLPMNKKCCAVAEAYGCYFNPQGKMVYSASTVAHDLGALKPKCAFIAVAAGSSKADAIMAVMRNRPHAMLVTDEGAAKAILAAQ